MLVADTIVFATKASTTKASVTTVSTTTVSTTTASTTSVSTTTASTTTVPDITVPAIVGPSPRLTAGFSLIELLVVIMIIGLGIQLVAFNVGGNQQRQIVQESKEFVNASSLIAEEAVLTRQQWGVDFYREFDDGNDRYGYRWLMQQNGRWVLAEQVGELPVDVLFSPGVQLRLEFDDVEQEIEQKREIIDTSEVEIVQGTGNALQGSGNVVQGGVAQSGDATQNNRRNTQLNNRRETIIVDSDDRTVEPHVWMLSSGEMTPFKLMIFDEENADTPLVIEGDELGRVNIETGDGVDDDER